MIQKRNKDSCCRGQEAFPSRNTICVGIWLLVFSALSVIGIFWAFLLIPRQALALAANIEGNLQIQESLVTMFAAGVGSSITTILGYLLHACAKKDFDPAYTPWYIARPVMGMLLGLVFYFVIKGGLLVLTAGNTTSGVGELNLWTLSATGALVGLFSKNAIEKLRELFNTLFKTQDEMNHELLNRLPKELRDKVSPYLGGELINRLPEKLRDQVSPYLEGGTGEVEDIPKGEDGTVKKTEGQPGGT